MTKLLLLAALAATCLAAGQPPAKPADHPLADKSAADTTTDKDLLQGSWVVTAAERDGAPLKDLVDKKATVTFKGDTVIDSTKPNDKVTFKIDPEKKPPTLDLTTTLGTESRSQRAIYKLDGDTLTICVAKRDKEYPKDFASKEGNVVLTLKRQKAE
jgi:uncharacterized protein (TIGR03067 family)